MQPKLPLPQALAQAHQSRFQSLLARFEKEKKIHPSILITGQSGVGKKESALLFAQTLFCDQVAGSGAPCGTCASCKRALNNQWIDLYWFEPESADEEKIGTHKIDTFRELKTKMGFGPTEEPFKVVIITDADRMTPAAANSILKILEEPPPQWIFILTSTDSTRLLPTIVSRCIELKLSPLTPEQIYEILKEVQGSHFQSNAATIASRAGMGSLVRAQYFLDEEMWKTRNLILGLLTNPSGEWMKLVDQLSQSQRQLGLGLDLLESILSDILRYQVQGSAAVWTHADQKDFLIQWASNRKLTSPKVVELLAKIADNRQYVGMSLNAKLLSQEVLIPLLETIFS